MKFVVSVVHKEDARLLVEALVAQKYRVTAWHTTGGFLREENVTLFSAVEDEQVDDLIRLIQSNCKTRTQHVASLPSQFESGELYEVNTREVTVGGAAIFVLDVDRFVKA